MSETLSMDQVFIRKLTEIVFSNLEDEMFGVEELAKKAGMSRSNIHRKLRSITHRSVTHFIREIRLQRAMEMLQQNAGTASEIAYKVGFESPAYFNKCFHEYWGFPPGEIRKRESVISESDQNGVKRTTSEPDMHLKNRKSLLSRWRQPGCRRPLIISMGVLIGMLMIYFLYVLLLKNSATSSHNRLEYSEKSIVVIPFTNLSDDKETQYFADGVMEDILNNLSRISALRVVSATTARQLREKPLTTPEIARKLKVNFALEGSIKKDGNKVRIHVQLIDARNDQHLWSEKYDNELVNIFTIQSDIAKGIANNLEAVISLEEKQLIEKRPTRSLQTYDFYKKGKEELNKFGLDAVNQNQIKRAEYLFKKALEYDPTFALAYTGLANIYWKKNFLEENIFKYFMDSMLVLANIALSHDEQLAEAYWIRGGYYAEKGNNNKAIEEYDKSIRLNPNDWQPYYAKGWLFGMYNDYPKSIENYQKAASLNHGSELTYLLRNIASLYTETGFPDKFNEYNLEALYLDGDTSAYLNNLVYSEYCNRNYKKALELLKRIYRTDSTYDDLDKQIGLNYMYSGQSKESLKYLKKWTEKQKASGVVPYKTINHWIGYVYLVNGYRKEADYYFDKTMEYYQNLSKSDRPHLYDLDLHYQLASIYAIRGDKARAIENLKLFNQSQRSPLMVARSIKVDHLFDSIRDEREFQQIVEDFESKWHAEHERVRKWLQKGGML